jgi:hypothetical protein
LTDIFSELQFSWRCPKTETKSTRYSKNSGKKKTELSKLFWWYHDNFVKNAVNFGQKNISRAAQEKTVNTV